MRAVKWMVILLSLALLAIAALWVTARIVYPTEAQRQAVAELERWPDFEGENAFPLLWTLGRAVPDDALAGVLAQDVETVKQQLDAPPRDEYGGVAYPTAAERFEDLTPGEEDRGRFCAYRAAGCLAHVRSDPEGFGALIDRHERLLERVDRLQDFGFIRSVFPPSVFSPFPRVTGTSLLRTRNAVWFAQGRQEAAVAAVCRDLLTWRRLGVRADSLIFLMQGIDLSSISNGYLLAEMLAELPVDRPLPAPCAEALAAPTSIDQSMCNAMRGEFAMSQAMLRRYVDEDMGALDRFGAWLLTDTEADAGARAEQYLYLCQHPEDRGSMPIPVGLDPERSGNLRRLACVGSLYTCVLHGLMSGGYSVYQPRVLDHGARLRALGTLAWMREQAGRGQSPAALLAARPEALVDPGDRLRFGPDGKTLQIDLRWAQRGEDWSIPLPPELYATP